MKTEMKKWRPVVHGSFTVRAELLGSFGARLRDVESFSAVSEMADGSGVRCFVF